MRIAFIRSPPSVLLPVEIVSEFLLVIIGDDVGVTKSSDKGLVIEVTSIFSSNGFSRIVWYIGSDLLLPIVPVEDVLEAILPVSDLVGLDCERELLGGLGGGGAVGLTGLVVAILAGRLDFECTGGLSAVYFVEGLASFDVRKASFSLST